MSRLDPPIGPDDHALGAPDGPGVVTLVQYGDVACPLSRDVFGIVAEVRAAFPDRVRAVFRHFPLREHPDAVPAAVALDAAGRQGAFWPFLERLFASGDLSPDALAGHADALGLDAAAVRDALADPVATAPILAAKKAGVAAGVRSSLNLFIDGTLYQERALDEALADHVIRPLRG